MIEDLGGVTSQLLRVALDASLMRHHVIANNIANHKVPGYSAKRLSFEDQFAGMKAAMANNDSEAMGTRIEAIKKHLNSGEAITTAEGESVELDREMIRLTENTLRYQALLRASSMRGEILRMAIKEGRS